MSPFFPSLSSLLTSLPAAHRRPILLPLHHRQQRAERDRLDVPPPAGASPAAQAHLAVAEQVRPALADAVLFLAEGAGAVVPVAGPQAQLVQDQRDQRAIIAQGPFRHIRRGGWGLGCGGGQGVEVVAVEAEGEGGWVGALALAFGGGGAGGRGEGFWFWFFFLAADGVVVEGAATLEVAAGRWVGVRFCDFGILGCVRLWFFGGCAGAGGEDDGAAEGWWWCTDDLGGRRECGEVAGEEGL